MNSDLFSSDYNFEFLPLQGAEVLLLRHLDLPRPAETLLSELIRETPWRSEEITVWGKKHLQPRLIAWYGDEGRNYTYSGISMNPLPWSQTLSELRMLVESKCNDVFNSVLLNYYRDGRDSMGFHSDNEPELGLRPTIASLSLGESRSFAFKPKSDIKSSPFNIELASGSLLLMKGDTQLNWKHGIAKSSRPLGPRVNLTFRKIEMPKRVEPRPNAA